MNEGEKIVVLVTGGAGFIGSHLCEALLKQGKRVICVDDFTTGHVRNIDPYLRNSDFQFLRWDINNPIDLEQFPELEPFKVKFLGIQEIYHLALPSAIKNFDKFRQHILTTNAVGTKNILDLALKYNAKIMLSSSSVVYGSRTADKFIFQEDDLGIVNHLTNRACYDEGKRFAETMFYTYKLVHGLDARIARIFRTFGPRMPLFEGHQVPDFVLAAFNNEGIVINGGEEFKTSLIYVNDVIDGITRMMSAKEDTGPVNIGSDEDLKLVDIANKIIEMVGSSSKVTFGEKLEFLSELGLPDVTKAKNTLGWLPVTRLEDGLQKTIDYIRANKILLTSD